MAKKLSKAYEKVGDFDLALTNYKNYVALTDKLYQAKENEINDAVVLTKDLAEKLLLLKKIRIYIG